jgi:hypothetical protein
MMDPNLKAKWVEALRSGEFNQTTGRLHDYEGFCCLGVLCFVQDPSFVTDFECLETANLIPGPLKDYSAGLDKKFFVILAAMNDGTDGLPRSFDHIAGYIASREDI